MKSIGVDLHKKTISLCVVVVVAGKRKVASRRRFDCQNTVAIRKFFEEQETFQVVVEATANYEWFLLLVEDLADRCVLAHPKKLRVIAECKHKSDKVDAQILAEFLAFGLAVYASQDGSPRHHARLASGRWSGATGRASHPQGSYERFQICILTSHPPFPSLTWRKVVVLGH